MSANRYFNRELSWLEFNARILEEALDRSNPLLERMKFLAIVSSNFDEFFMVRVASLKAQLRAGDATPDGSGMSPAEQLAAVARRAREIMSKQYECLAEILPALAGEGLAVVQALGLDRAGASLARGLFLRARLSPPDAAARGRRRRGRAPRLSDDRLAAHPRGLPPFPRRARPASPWFRCLPTSTASSACPPKGPRPAWPSSRTSSPTSAPGSSPAGASARPSSSR